MAPPSYASFTTQLLEFCYRQKQKRGVLDAVVVSSLVLKDYTSNKGCIWWGRDSCFRVVLEWSSIIEWCSLLVTRVFHSIVKHLHLLQVHHLQLNSLSFVINKSMEISMWWLWSHYLWRIRREGVLLPNGLATTWCNMVELWVFGCGGYKFTGFGGWYM